MSQEMSGNTLGRVFYWFKDGVSSSHKHSRHRFPAITYFSGKRLL